MAKFDDVLSSINDWGVYQKIRYILICLSALLPPMATYLYSFVAPNLNFKCVDENVTVLYSKINDNTCKFKNVNDTDYTCQKWVFDKSYYKNTLTEEWSMICDYTFLRANVQTIYFIGYLTGSLVLGQLSDLYGRRPIMMISYTLILIGAIGSAIGPQQNYYGFVISYAIYAFSRFIIAVGTRGINETGYVLALELVGSKCRTSAAIVFEHFFSLGQLTLVLIAYFVRDWRLLSVIFIIPCIPTVLYFFILPESPRWLISKNRPEQAFQILESVAKTNKTKLNRELWESFLTESKKEEKGNETFLTLIKSLIKYPMLSILLLTMFLNWSITAFVFYGVGLRANDLGVNPYLSFAIAAFVELLACSFTLLIINKMGRKRAYSGFLFAAGISCLSIVFTNNLIGSLVLAMIGKFSISASYAILRLYSNEVFPTSIRNSCLGACSTISRLGVIFAPIINSLGDRHWKSLPFLVFGILGVLGSFSTFLLPETKNKSLPENLQEANNKMHSLGLSKKKHHDHSTNKIDKEIVEHNI